MTKQTEKIWIDYHNKLLSFIYSRVNNGPVAEDILQDVFVRIHARIDTLKEENKLSSWLYQITRNAIIDYYRARKLTEDLPETLLSPEEDPTEKVRKDIEGCLEPMIASLPNKYRQALVLSDIEGRPQKELAKTQDLSLSGAKSRIQRARAMLKDMMLECCTFEYDNRDKVVDYEVKGNSCDKC